jgi:hypothetical protein
VRSLRGDGRSAPRAALRVVTLAFFGGAILFLGQSCGEEGELIADASPERSAFSPTDAPVGDATTTPTDGRAGADAGIDDGSIADGSIVDGSIDDASVEDAEVPEGGYLEAGAACDDAGTACAPGFGCCVPCCLAGRAAVCTPLVMAGAAGACPLPDLSVNANAMYVSLKIESVDGGACELEEGCLADAGRRRVLRFDVNVLNQGAADLVLGRPDASTAFEYAACHAHHHFSDFARYTLLDDAGAAVVVGRKQAFCARDSKEIIPGTQQPKYDCEFQGISRGWEDDYSASLPCQWLDVTDVPSGMYRLEVVVNPANKLTELRYDNNRVSIPVKIP